MFIGGIVVGLLSRNRPTFYIVMNANGLPNRKALPTPAGSFNIGIIELKSLINTFPAVIQFYAVNKLQIAFLVR